MWYSCPLSMQQLLHSLMFWCVCKLIHAIISAISLLFFSLQLGQINIKEMPFPQGCYWTNFWQTGWFFLLFIYYFLREDLGPSKSTAWFTPSVLGLCAHASATLPIRVVSLCLTQSAPVEVVDLLLSACCGVKAFASAPGKGARNHVQGGSNSTETTQSTMLSK